MWMEIEIIKMLFFSTSQEFPSVIKSAGFLQISDDGNNDDDDGGRERGKKLQFVEQFQSRLVLF